MTMTRRFSTRLAAVTVALATATALSACASDSGSEGEGEDAEATSVETMFGTVDIPAPDDGELTVVALGWSDAEMALALGVTPVATFDWQAFGAENKGVGPWATDLFGDVEPTIIERGAETLNYEQILGLDPDVILNTRSSNDREEYDRLSEIAPTVNGPEGAGAYATEWRDQMALVGQALGRADEAEGMISEVEDDIEQAAADHPELDGITVASAAKFGDAYGGYLPGDGRFDLLSELGLVNNPAIEDLEASGFFANVSAENVSAFDADVAVILPIGFSLEETRDDALLSSLDVVKDDRAIYLDPDSELGGAWGTASVLSIPLVLDQLVPQLSEAANQS